MSAFGFRLPWEGGIRRRKNEGETYDGKVLKDFCSWFGLVWTSEWVRRWWFEGKRRGREEEERREGARRSSGRPPFPSLLRLRSFHLLPFYLFSSNEKQSKLSPSQVKVSQRKKELLELVEVKGSSPGRNSKGKGRAVQVRVGLLCSLSSQLRLSLPPSFPLHLSTSSSPSDSLSRTTLSKPSSKKENKSSRRISPPQFSSSSSPSLPSLPFPLPHVMAGSRGGLNLCEFPPSFHYYFSLSVTYTRELSFRAAPFEAFPTTRDELQEGGRSRGRKGENEVLKLDSFQLPSSSHELC